MKKSSALILAALLAITALLTVLAVQPVEAAKSSNIRQVTAAACTFTSCGSWRYYGCCYVSGGYRLRQARDCTNDGINYCTQTRCTTSLCPM